MDERLILAGVGEPRKRPPSPADKADAQALDRAVQTMIQQVLSGWDHTRPLGSLNRDDLRKIASAAISGWIIERAGMAKCGDAAIGEELTSCAGFVAETLAPTHGPIPAPKSNRRATASSRSRGQKT